MGKVDRFEDLRIWQDARIIVKEIYNDFPDCKDWGFKDQVQRAAVSIMNNIAEGFERRSDKEFARFLDIAKGSCGEVRSMYYVAEDLQYVSKDIAEIKREKGEDLSGGIAGLMNHLKGS
jgi:four helix bundle protein